MSPGDSSRQVGIQYTECAGETLLRGSLCGVYLLSMSNDKQWSFSDSSDIDHWIWKKLLYYFCNFKLKESTISANKASVASDDGKLKRSLGF